MRMYTPACLSLVYQHSELHPTVSIVSFYQKQGILMSTWPLDKTLCLHSIQQAWQG